MKHFPFSPIVACVAIVALCAPVAAIELHLKDEVHCTGSLVRLGDVAEIVPPAATDGSLLADLVLFPAPAANRTRELSRQELRQLLALCDVDVRDVSFAGAEVLVIRAGAVKEKSIIRPALHLIPASAYIKTGRRKAEERAGVAEASATDSKLVSRNQGVSIYSIWPGVKVTASGKSLADGVLGDSILVEQSDSRERVLAKVIGPQTVEIRFPAK